MKRARITVFLATAIGLSGCTLRPMTLTFPTTGAVATQPAANPTQPGIAAPTSHDAYGTFSLTVRWPDRPVGYRAQLIPDSTNALIITIRQPGTLNSLDQPIPGAIITQTTVTRNPGATTASASFQLKAANNLSVEVAAYRESAPTYGVSTVIAQTSGNLNIQPSHTSSLSLPLNPSYVPAIQSLSTNVGLPGDTVTITGTNFGTSSVAVPVVVFNTATASSVVRNSAGTQLTVQVPQGVNSGFIHIYADGVPIAAGWQNQFAYWIPSSVTISASKASWDTKTGANGRAVLLGNTLQFSASSVWQFATGESAINYGTPPAPGWSCTNASAGSVDATGLFTAGSSYASGSVTANLGSVTSNALSAVSEDVQVTLNTPAASLGGKGASSLALGAFNTLSDGATNSLVSYTADPAMSVDSTGLLTGGTGVNGTVTATASSQLMPQRSASTSVTLSNYVVSTFAGSPTANGNVNGTGTSARFSYPDGVAVDSAGNVYVGDGNLAIRKITPSGAVSTLASGNFNVNGIAVGSDGTVYFSDKSNAAIYSVTPAGAVSLFAGTKGTSGYQDGATSSAQFDYPYGLAVDGTGAVYVADELNQCIRKIQGGVVSTLAGTPGTSGSADGAGGNATFYNPCGVALDGSGNVYVADTGNGRIRKITSAGVVATLATGFNNPWDLVVDANGYVYVTNQSQNQICKISPTGHVQTVAGDGTQAVLAGVGTKARLYLPIGIGLDSSGNLYTASEQAILKLH